MRASGKAMNSDASRLAGWEAPFHAPDYVVGLADGFGHKLDDDPMLRGLRPGLSANVGVDTRSSSGDAP